MIAGEAHAKVNLRHRVWARDETGFHAVETLLARTSLSDTVVLEDSGESIGISVDGPRAEGVPEGTDNLCWAAADRFLRRAFPRRSDRPGVHVRLTKRIPMGSGLGGGSADAGATLRLLARRWGRLTDRDLVEIAGALGSDVPFALLAVPMALGWERGRRLLPLRPPRPRPALLVHPGVHVSTPDAYGWLAADRGDACEAGAAVFPGPTRLTRWESLERLVRNDLEAPVAARHPEIAECLAHIRALEPPVAGMTGSGSAVFAIFADEPERDRAERALAGLLDPSWERNRIEVPV